MHSAEVHRLAEHLVREGYVDDDVSALAAAVSLLEAAERFCKREDGPPDEAAEA
jgi:hypothetical protein